MPSILGKMLCESTMFLELWKSRVKMKCPCYRNNHLVRNGQQVQRVQRERKLRKGLASFSKGLSL